MTPESNDNEIETSLPSSNETLPSYAARTQQGIPKSDTQAIAETDFRTFCTLVWKLGVLHARSVWIDNVLLPPRFRTLGKKLLDAKDASYPELVKEIRHLLHSLDSAPEDYDPDADFREKLMRWASGFVFLLKSWQTRLELNGKYRSLGEAFVLQYGESKTDVLGEPLRLSLALRSNLPEQLTDIRNQLPTWFPNAVRTAGYVCLAVLAFPFLLFLMPVGDNSKSDTSEKGSSFSYEALTWIGGSAQTESGSTVAQTPNSRSEAGSTIGFNFGGIDVPETGTTTAYVPNSGSDAGSTFGGVEVPSTNRIQAADIQIIKLSAEQLLDTYSDNSFAADKKYKGKSLEVAGIVRKVSQERDGILVQLKASGHNFHFVRCLFGEEKASDLLQIKKGDNVTVIGTCAGEPMFYGGVGLTHCFVR